MSTPIVVCVRDPDSSNDFAVFGGDVEVYDIDLGNSDLDSEEEFVGWAESHIARLEALPDDAAAYVWSIVWEEYVRRSDDHWPTLRRLKVTSAYADDSRETSRETAVFLRRRNDDETDVEYELDIDDVLFALTGTGRTDDVGSFYEVDSIDGIEPAIHSEWSD